MIQVARGRLSKQIAGDLGIAETTVKVHRSKAMRKMNVHSLPEFGRMADSARADPASMTVVFARVGANRRTNPAGAAFTSSLKLSDNGPVWGT
jgi:DNA-binding NarL/FixJ family response regulator